MFNHVIYPTSERYATNYMTKSARIEDDPLYEKRVAQAQRLRDEIEVMVKEEEERLKTACETCFFYVQDEHISELSKCSHPLTITQDPYDGKFRKSYADHARRDKCLDGLFHEPRKIKKSLIRRLLSCILLKKERKLF